MERNGKNEMEYAFIKNGISSKELKWNRNSIFFHLEFHYIFRIPLLPMEWLEDGIDLLAYSRQDNCFA